jgi:hypothetical protein
MRRKIAEAYKLTPIYHCPIFLCGHTEKSALGMIEHLIHNYTDEDYWNENKKNRMKQNKAGQGNG